MWHERIAVTFEASNTEVICKEVPFVEWRTIFITHGNSTGSELITNVCVLGFGLRQPTQ